MSCNPAYVVRIDLTPISGSPILWKASVRPFPTSDAYEGLIRGGVIDLGDLRQSMCDREGSPVVNSFSFTVFDPLNYWRDLLADNNTQYLTSQDVTYLFASAEAIAEEDYDLTSIFRGQITNPSPLPGKRFSFNAESRLGTRKGPYDLDSPVNKITAQRAVDDGFTGVPRDSLEKRLPALWGEKTDKGTLNEFGELVEMGLCPGVNLGPLPGNDPQYLPKAGPLTFQKYLNGSPVSASTVLPGNETYTYLWAWVTLDGQYALSDPLTITGMPSAANFSGDGSGHRGFGTGVRITCALFTDPAHNALIADPPWNATLHGRIWVKRGDASSTNPYRMLDATDDDEYDHNGDDRMDKTHLPGPPHLSTQVQTNADAGDFWCFLRHSGKITQLFLKDMFAGEGGEARYAQVGEGVGVNLGGGGTGLNSVVNGHHYFGVILSGAYAIAAKDGFPPRANLCGWHQDNNLANPIINQAAYCVQDVIVQMSTGADGTGYASGARLSIPNYASFPSVPIIQTSRIQETQDITKAFLGTSLGYLACIYFGPDDSTTWRGFLEQQHHDFGFDHFENEHGQFALSVMDDTQSPDDGTLLRERIELAQVVDAGAVQSDEIQNLERYEYDYAPIEGTYRSGVKEIRNLVSISKYGERHKGEGQVTGHKYTNDAATAQDAAARMLADRAIGPSYPTVVGKLRKMIPIALGRQYRIQHSDLVIEQPFPVYLRERVISEKNGTITLRGRDRRGSYALAAAPDDTVGTDYSDATADELLTYAFATDDNGLLPDGTLGSRVR